MNTDYIFPSFLGYGAIVAGRNGVLNKEKQYVDLLHVNPTDYNATENKTYFFGSDSPSTDIGSTPYADGPFYGFRQVLISKIGNQSHLVTVVILETYPISGRIFSNTYDTGTGDWYGWHFSQMQG